MIKLFISYSHKDETLVSKFINHISPLKNNGLIEEWYDRKIKTGDNFQGEIDNSLEDADLICLMISDNFLSSNACMDEKNISLKLRLKKGIRVIPIILSPCLWTEDNELSELLAIPTDGKAITTFENQNSGWVDSIKWIKTICNSINRISELKLTESFNDFLNSADILTKSHKNKEQLFLKDIFVFPTLKRYDAEEVAQKYNSKDFVKDIIGLKKIIIAGENQAGKTTLSKVLFKIFRDLKYIPIYLSDNNQFLGNPIKKLEKAFLEQYEADSISDFDYKRVVPIVDDFHFAKHQEKYINDYEVFNNQILIVDDIFGLNIKNQALIKKYDKFKIREFVALERNELIKKWIQVKEDVQVQMNPNHLQQSIDEKTEIIENSLGVVFNKGIMPSYPFFILTLLAAQDIQKPLDQEITSQGYCYQALIYLYLRKEGVKNDQINIYSNFLTELSFELYKNGGVGLPNNELLSFIEKYKLKFNLPIPLKEVLLKLSKANISQFDSLNNYNFYYSYIYYFFIAKYLSEHIEKEKEIIDKIIGNLHKDENAYITIFMAHHTKSGYLMDELLLNAEILFEKYKPATLDSDELSFFDQHEEKIIKAVLPSYQYNVQEERRKRLVEKSNIDEIDEEKEDFEEEDQTSELLADLRISIKTVEVLGMIIKNRSGSLDLKRLEYIFEQGLKVHLRIITSFIELINNEKAEKEIVELLTDRINQIIENRKVDNEKELSIDKIEKLARAIFWNVNFGVIHGFITKAIHSLGSINLLEISKNVSRKENTPAAFVVHQGINMWYNKNVRVQEIAERIKEKDFSKTAVNLMKFKVVEHCKLHNISFRDLEIIENELHIKRSRIMLEKAKNK